MLWLASFPRSGNTYLRVILDRVYYVGSSEYINLHHMLRHIRRYQAPVIKTHQLPKHLFPKSKRIPAVYLVRDGRDSLVSWAHLKKDIKDPGSDYISNLRDVIMAADGKYFGGWSSHYFGSWSTHVNAWLKRADIVIRYEDLVRDPIQSVEKIRPFIDLPQHTNTDIPTFEEMKYSTAEEISESITLGIKTKSNRRQNFFRRGISGAWKDEMPDDLHKLFWELHGDTMVKLGYTEGML